MKNEIDFFHRLMDVAITIVNLQNRKLFHLPFKISCWSSLVLWNPSSWPVKIQPRKHTIFAHRTVRHLRGESLVCIKKSLELAAKYVTGHWFWKLRIEPVGNTYIHIIFRSRLSSKWRIPCDGRISHLHPVFNLFVHPFIHSSFYPRLHVLRGYVPSIYTIFALTYLF